MKGNDDGRKERDRKHIEKAKTLSPDVITMDVEMPKMNGIEAVKRIMAEEPTPVVMLSGTTKKNADVTLEALANGAFDFVTKPSGTLSLDIEKVKDELIAKIPPEVRKHLTRSFPHFLMTSLLECSWFSTCHPTLLNRLRNDWTNTPLFKSEKEKRMI
ncbi:MAG: response regulator [Methanocellales archaeon]|nr:response regulator [Methanocellales archaeon]